MGSPFRRKLAEGEERPLTQEEKKKILKVIGEKMQPDDRYPEEIIKENYDGDRERYLRDMAAWHNILLDN